MLHWKIWWPRWMPGQLPTLGCQCLLFSLSWPKEVPPHPGISHQSRGAGVAGADSAGSSQGIYFPSAQASARSYALPNPKRGIWDTTQDIASPLCLRICPSLCLEYSSSLLFLALNFPDAVLPGLVVKILEMLPYRLAHHFCPESWRSPMSLLWDPSSAPGPWAPILISLCFVLSSVLYRHPHVSLLTATELH